MCGGSSPPVDRPGSRVARADQSQCALHCPPLILSKFRPINTACPQPAIVYNIYRPQHAALDVSDVFGLASYEKLLVAGDFNCHHPWLGSNRAANDAGRALLASFEDSGHVSLLNDTRCTTHQHLAFISLPVARSSSWRLHPTLSSDHFGVIIDVAVSRAPPPPSQRRFLMGQADWGRFKFQRRS